MPARRILVFPDCGPRIGGGHVMRCVTLAAALARRGATVAFVGNPAAQHVLAAFGPRDMTVFPVSDDLQEAAPAAEAWADSFKADWVVLDHYRLGREQEAALRAGRRLAVLDDLADRPRPADLLLNPAYGVGAAQYEGLLPDGASVLAGPAHALVRAEFAAHREAALLRRRQGGRLKHVLVSLGLTDVDGITGRVVRALRPAFPELVFDVALGDEAPSLPALREAAKTDPHLRLHVDTHAMAELAAQADVGVGAGGGSTWERAVVGLPAVTVVLAENQRPMAQALDRDGFTVALAQDAPDFDARLVAAVHWLVTDAAVRRSLSEKSAALCDGEGAGRAAEALLGIVINL